MIQYALKCADGHSFDSWFQSAEAFDKLAGAGLVSCAVCGSDQVAKAMMTPRVGAGRQPARETVPDAEAQPKPGPLSQPSSPAEQALIELRRRIEKNSTYVGDRFAAEARAMHLGDAPERAIHGEARTDEARRLIEDGVPVAPLPFLPNRKSN